MAEETTPVIGENKPKKTATVPVKDLDFANVATLVSTKWTANTWLILKWTTAADFATKATS